LIEIHQEFDVPASPDVVWKVISDPYEIVTCVPGAVVTGRRDDGTYEGSIVVKFGPTSVSFQTLVALELNPAIFSVRPAVDGRGSSVRLLGGVEISGPLAELVESGASFVIKRLTQVCAQRLAKKCSPSHQE
jgi:carbon monoxide dehydrogenase subunit G